MRKPKLEEFGFVYCNHYELEGGWAVEGGEEAYWQAMKRYEDFIESQKATEEEQNDLPQM